MQSAETRRAVAAAQEVTASLGLDAREPEILQNSNKLTLRLRPADVVARIAPADQQNAAFELELAVGLAAAGSPIAPLARGVPVRVFETDGFVLTFWAFCEPVGEPAPAEYAIALARLHAGMRDLDVVAPHFTDRVASAQVLVADPLLTPRLREADRDLLGSALTDLKRSVDGHGRDQLLHGEPYPGNVLRTRDATVFIDLETCCRGPVEFDLAHAPAAVAAHYPGLDEDLLSDCRLLMHAMVTAWRWDRSDQFPDGQRLGQEWLDQLRVELSAWRGARR